jgi:hypothetical protein
MLSSANEPDPDKLRAVREYPVPTKLIAVHKDSFE